MPVLEYNISRAALAAVDYCDTLIIQSDKNNLGSHHKTSSKCSRPVEQPKKIKRREHMRLIQKGLKTSKENFRSFKTIKCGFQPSNVNLVEVETNEQRTNN